MEGGDGETHGLFEKLWKEFILFLLKHLVIRNIH